MLSLITLGRLLKTFKAIVIPPTYFIWEKAFFGEPAPFCVSVHPAVNTWGTSQKRNGGKQAKKC